MMTESKVRKVTPADVDRVREAVLRAWGDECAAKVSATERGISIGWPSCSSEQALDKIGKQGMRWGAEGWICDWPEPAPAPAEMPAWLTAAVLAALPVDGTPRTLSHVDEAIGRSPREYTLDDLREVLHRLVVRGDVENGPDWHRAHTWRRWGVPDGWAWRPLSDGGEECLPSDGSTRHLRAFPDGSFSVNPGSGWPGHALSSQVPSGGLRAAKRAAIRAGWERGLFAAPAPALGMSPAEEAERDHEPLHPDPRIAAEVQRDMDEGRAVDRTAGIREGWHKGKRTPQAVTEPVTATPTRAEQVRHALLAVLEAGAVSPFARVVELLATEGLADAPTMAEALKAAREIGALVNGARWSLPDVPLGWVWETSSGVVHSYLRRGRQRVANVTEDGSWFVYPANVDRSIVNGRVPGDPDAAQAAAIYAARRAGLFAVDAPAAESEDPAERLPDPAGVALSPECDAIDRLVLARDATGLGALAERLLRERREAEAQRDKIRAAVGSRSPEWAGRYADALDAAGTALIFKGERNIKRLSDLTEQIPHDTAAWVALTAILRTLDTGPAREEHAGPAPVAATPMPERVLIFHAPPGLTFPPEPSESPEARAPVAVEATRWPRAVLARALASGGTGDDLDKALDAWGASLIAEARRGLTVPHEVVHQHLAERAYAEDALYLYEVWQAAMRWREARTTAPRKMATIGAAVNALDALLDREPAPREPEPHPHRDGNETPAETIERIARERNEERLRNELWQRDVVRAEDERDEARLEAEAATARAYKAERELSVVRETLDALCQRLAKGGAT